jgi:PncC family amidohydrolase
MPNNRRPGWPRCCCRRGGQRVCTAESCTGGLIAKTFTDLAGSSDWFERGFVTYSNEAKSEMLAVPASIIEDYGAVSEPVATAMASGALRHSRADYAIAVTGVAGPGGGSEEKPVGTVWIPAAAARKNRWARCGSQSLAAINWSPGCAVSMAIAARCAPRPWRPRSKCCSR